MTRFPRPVKKAGRRAGGGARQAWLIVGIGAILVLAALATQQYTIAKSREAAAAARNDEEIYTGSILYMPDEGSVCRQLLFDNHNGQFSDNGYVDCGRAAYRGADSPKQWSAARVRVIATGFRQH